MEKEIKMDLINSNTNQIGMNVKAYNGTKDHSKLQNLDFEHSGHTGFQPEGDYPDEVLTNSDIEELLKNFS